MDTRRKIRIYTWVLMGLLGYYLFFFSPLVIYQQWGLSRSNFNFDIQQCSQNIDHAQERLHNELSSQFNLQSSESLISKFIYEYKNSKWVLNEQYVNPKLEKLYGLKIDDYQRSIDPHLFPHVLSDEIKLAKIKLNRFEIIQISFVSNKQKLHIVFRPLHQFQAHLAQSSNCYLHLVDRRGQGLVGTIPEVDLKDFFVQLQSISTDLQDSVQIEVPSYEMSYHYYLKPLFRNLYVLGQIRLKNSSFIQNYISFFKFNSLLVFIFVVATGVLFSQTLFERLSWLKKILGDISVGEYHLTTHFKLDPISREIEESIIQLSNSVKTRMRNFLKNKKLSKILDIDILQSFKSQHISNYQGIILELSITNHETILNDFKFHKNLGEFSSFWSNICEMIGDHGGFIDTFAAGHLRAIWPIEKIEPTQVYKVTTLSLEIQDLLQALNRSRFYNGLGPYKVYGALHVGDVLFANLGPMEYRDFTVLGPSISMGQDMCSLSRKLNCSLLISQSTYEYINKKFLFTVMDEQINGEKLYSLHTGNDPVESRKKMSGS